MNDRIIDNVLAVHRLIDNVTFVVDISFIRTPVTGNTFVDITFIDDLFFSGV